MSSSIKTIKLTIFLSLLFLVITYLVTVNMEMGIVCFNSGWISNNFFLTVFGGAFGSTIVVLICELHRYWLLKKETETKIYNLLYSILAEIVVSNNTIRTYLEDTKLTVPCEALDSNRARAMTAFHTLETVDYRSFFGKSKLELTLARFFQGAYQSIKQFVSDEQFLKNAVLLDKIELVEHGVPDNVSAECKNAEKTLRFLLAAGQAGVDDMKTLLERLDSICNGRFNWSYAKQIIESVQTVLPLDEYEKFIASGEDKAKSTSKPSK